MDLRGLFGVALCVLPACAASPASPAVGLSALYRLDRLPRFSQALHIGAVTSYDPTGGNDDGFSGKHSFVRREGGDLVIAELEGPGVVTRIWTPTPTDDVVSFYFDGEASPRLALPFRELFTGARPPFVEPVVGHGAGGFWSYLPLTYRRSLRIVVRAAEVHFFQVNFATYPSAQPIDTFDPQAPTFEDDLEEVRDLWRRVGSDISDRLTVDDAPVHRERVRGTLLPGQRLVVWEHAGGGRILGLRLGPVAAFAGPARAITLRIGWDGEAEPAVDVPVGDFFGYAWGEPATRSLLLGTEGDEDYVYLPMPFDGSAKVELGSELAGGPAVEVEGELLWSDVPRRGDEGRFHAVWRRENPTRRGTPFTFVDVRGRGHVVGVSLQAQGLVRGKTSFFEGDELVTIDGALAIHGTGSEDFFNGGWYDIPGQWDGRRSFPLTGCLGYDKSLARTGAYRFMLGDPLAFRESLSLTIEHGPQGNRELTDYVGVTYLYADRPLRHALAPLAERAVRE